MKHSRALVITICLAVSSVLGTTASIYSVWVGLQPTWARVVVGSATIFILLLVALLLHSLWPVLRTNARGVPLIIAVKNVGLIDLESRNEGDRHLPAEALYSSPSLQEIVITGITSASSFRNHSDLIKKRLAAKVDVYFLICSERTVGLDTISTIELRNMAAEIQEVREVIAAERLLSDERFHIRCFTHLPTFTAIMIDGDLVPRQNPPQDSKGVIRLQPRRMESTHHEGIILQFENTCTDLGTFNLFAADLRKQWAAAEPWR